MNIRRTLTRLPLLIVAMLLAGLVLTQLPAEASAPIPPPASATAITTEGGSGITPPIFCFLRNGIRFCKPRPTTPPPPLRPRPIRTR